MVSGSFIMVPLSNRFILSENKPTTKVLKTNVLFWISDGLTQESIHQVTVILVKDKQNFDQGGGCKSSINKILKIIQITCVILVDQIWPAGIVVASVCLDIHPCVNKFFYVLTYHPFQLGSTNFYQRCNIRCLNPSCFGELDLALQRLI